MNNSLMTRELALSLWYYDPDTGIMYNKPSRHNAKAGSVAGSKNDNRGYIRIGYEGKRYYLHRLAFLMMTGSWPADEIDHIDRNNENNKWDNIRSVTHIENNHNKYTNNHFRGVSWDKHAKKWRGFASKINKKQKSLGYFTKYDDAVKARIDWEKETNFKIFK